MSAVGADKSAMPRPDTHGGVGAPDVTRQYDHVCRLLNLDDDVKEKGLGVLNIILGMQLTALPDAYLGGVFPQSSMAPGHSSESARAFTSPVNHAANVWTACALFIANTRNECDSKQHAGTSGNKGPDATETFVGAWNGVKFSTLMAATKLRIMSFFDNMGIIQTHSKRSLLNLPASFDAKLNCLKTIVVTDSAMYRKFVELWEFRDELGAQNVVSKKGKKAVETHLLQFSWTLFVLLKSHLYGDAPNLVDAYHLLIACVVLTIEGHSAHQTKALSDRRERQSGTSPVPHLPVEVLEQEREAEAIAALMGVSSTRAVVVPTLPSSSSKTTVVISRKPGDVLRGFLAYIGNVEYSNVMSAVECVEKYVEDLILYDDLKSFDSPPRLLGSIVSAKFQGTLGKHIAVNSYFFSTKYEEENLVSAWDLDERIFLRQDAVAQIGTPIKFNSGKRIGTVPVNTGSFKKLFQDAPADGKSQQTLPPPVAPASVAPMTGMMVHQVRSVLSPVRSPNNILGAVEATPVTEAFQYNAWLRCTVQVSPKGPSDVLMRCFEKCQSSPLESISGRLEDMLNCLRVNEDVPVVGTLNLDEDALGKSKLASGIGIQRGQISLVRRSDGVMRRAFSTVANGGSTSSGRGRRDDVDTSPNASRRTGLRFNRALDLSVRLYWRVLGKIVERDEIKRMSAESVEQLLFKDEFHRCMFALATDVVLVAHGITTMVFPAVPVKLEIHAASLIKMIEIFVRGETSLPGQLRRHLRWCEEQILEWHAWAHHSPMMAKLRSLKEPLRKFDSMSPFEIAHHRSDLNIPFTVEKFLEKVEQLAASRLRSLNDILQLPDSILDQAWTVCRHAILCKDELLCGRHLHQIILAAIFSIGKVNKMELKFARIITAYKRIPELFSPANLSAASQQAARSKVFSDISLAVSNVNAEAGSEGRGDIIKFYNYVFLPQMKEFVVQFSGISAITIQPVPEIRTRFPRATQYAGANVIVTASRASNRLHHPPGTSAPSGMSQYPAGIENTPRTAALYAHREATSISRINQRLNGDPLSLAPAAIAETPGHCLEPPTKKVRTMSNGQTE
jgi:hypothetical protein